jgi:hypothetical protein
MSFVCELLDQSLVFRVLLTVAVTWLGVRVLDRWRGRVEEQAPDAGTGGRPGLTSSGASTGRR